MRTQFLLVHVDQVTASGLQLEPTKIASVTGAVDIYGGLYSWAYQRIAQSFGEALSVASAAVSNDQRAKLVVTLDSPGGYVTGCFETCADIIAMRERHPNVDVTVFSDGMICSAAYALGCAMSSSKGDEIVATPNALIGSIGVLATRVEEDLEKLQPGLAFHYFATGDEKIEGRMGTMLTKGEAKRIQADVDQLGTSFFDLVSESRPLSVDAVKDLNAGTFRGDAALAHKLIDRVVASKQSLFAKAKTETAPPKAAVVEKPKVEDMSAELIAAKDAELAASAKRIAELEAAASEAAKVAAAAAKQADADKVATLIASRPDLSEKTITLLKTYSFDQASAMIESLPVAAAPIKPVTTIVEPLDVQGTKFEGKIQTVGADGKGLDSESQRTLDLNLEAVKLSEKQLERCSYDPISGTLTVR